MQQIADAKLDMQGRAFRSRVGVWTPALDFVPASSAQEMAAEIESLGFASLWFPEFAGRDPFVHLALVLGATQSLVGATGIANVYARDAISMNAAAQALAEAYPQRFILGIGVSHANAVAGFRGHEYTPPLLKMATYLDALDKAPYGGFRPTSAHRRVLAALGPKMLELAARRADGVHTFLVPPEHTHAARQALGNDAVLCAEQAVVLTDDRREAFDVARAHVASYVREPNYARNLLRLGFDEAAFQDGGSDGLIERLVACGNTQAIADRVAEHLAAGADHVAINVLHPERRGVPRREWNELAPALVRL